MDVCARLFLCARCRLQVMLCSSCDHGNRYCGSHCATLARKGYQKMASQRYQRTSKGCLNNAARQARSRLRISLLKDQSCEIVTHHPSHQTPVSDLLRSAAARSAIRITGHCHGCGKPCSSLVRISFFRRNMPGFRKNHPLWPQGP